MSETSCIATEKDREAWRERGDGERAETHQFDDRATNVPAPP